MIYCYFEGRLLRKIRGFDLKGWEIIYKDQLEGLKLLESLGEPIQYYKSITLELRFLGIPIKRVKID